MRQSRFVLVAAILIALVASSVAGCSGIHTANKDMYRFQDLAWTTPPTPDQVHACRKFLSEYKTPKDAKGKKVAVVLQVGTRVNAHDIDIWSARVCTRGNDRVTLFSNTAQSNTPLNAPIKSLKDLAFIQPGALIAYTFDDANGITPNSVKVLKNPFMTIG
jgi:hypothetical protein